MEFKTGDLVEVLADDPTRQYWYGELIGVNPLSVNYISLYKDDVWRFDESAYHVDKESINFVVNMSKKSKASGWRELGYIYRGDHEIIHVNDVDSEDDDDEWMPDAEEEEEEEEDEDSDEVDSADDSVVEESEPEDIIDSNEEDDESEEEDDESEEVLQTKRKRTSTKKE